MVKKLSLEEYKEIGTEMKFLGNRLTALYVRVANGIGVTKNESKQLDNIVNAFNKCKSDLEELMFSQYNEKDGCDTHVFYGERELPSDLQYKNKEA
jgi:hypothetical protein